MPTPLVNKIPLIGNFNAKKTVWGNRGAFNPGYKKYSLKPIQIVKILEKKLKKKANYHLLKTKKQKWDLSFNKNIKYFEKAKINFNKKYFIQAINKYY